MIFKILVYCFRLKLAILLHTYRLERKLGKGGFGQVYIGRKVIGSWGNTCPIEVQKFNSYYCICISTVYFINILGCRLL
ncbi:putative protein kinase-like domain superfamily [Helianthus anomalus]